MWVNKTQSKAHGLELVQIVGKNSVESHLSEWKGTCIELSYDVTSENYLSFGVNGKQLVSNILYNIYNIYCIYKYICNILHKHTHIYIYIHIFIYLIYNII